MRIHFFLSIFALLLHTQVYATLTVTKQTCNHQEGLALSQGDITLGWQMHSDRNGDKQTAYQICVYENITNKQVYSTGKVKSSQSQLVSIPSLHPNKHGYYWQVRVWDGKHRASAWSGKQHLRIVPSDIDAKWIGAISRKDAKLPQGRFSNGVFKKDSFKTLWAPVDTLSVKSIIMRKAFETSKRSITDAIVYVSGLGHYELKINGEKVGDSEFAPLWSEYEKTVYYNVFDVTSLLRSGRNAISVLLGNGFFNVQRQGRYSKLQTSFGPPQLLLRMEINYDDGSSQAIVSNTDWHYTLSPITFNSIYGGESYDARMEIAKCHLPHYNDSHWKQAVEVEGPIGTLAAQTAPPVKIMERYGIQQVTTLPADSIEAASKATKRTIHPSVFIADMGQNLAGFPEITVSGQRGQKVTMVVSESLNKYGVCDQRQTGRQHYYEYTLKGDGIETWHPRFSYYGFRYIQVEGAVLEGQVNPHQLPVIKKLNSCFIYNSAPEVSTFECSNPLFTQTHRLIERAERSNMQAVFTDCPHREKLGWLEQDHLCGPSLLYNYNITSLVPKVIRDITDTQKTDGMVPTTAPQYVSFGNLFDDSPEWGSTLIILPFMYYDFYGDSTLIIRNYSAMKRYADYLESRATDGIVNHGLGDWYDYGPWRAGFSRNTPIPLVATAHYIYDLQLLCKAAQMMNKPQDKQMFEQRLNMVTNAFNHTFYKADSCKYGTGSQASNALPLFLGICGNNKDKVLASLLADIAAHGNRLTTGDVGNRYLFQTLAHNGKNDLLYSMLNHYETPGYGFQLKYGATTLTEQWDPREGASWNHFMMGQIDEWLFATLAGISNQPGTHGMQHLRIAPTLVGDLQWVKASTETLYGKVRVECSTTVLTVEIPVGSEATVVLPSGTEHAVGSGTHTFQF